MSLKRYSLKSRQSKINHQDFAQIPSTDSFNDFLDALPSILKAKELKEFISKLKKIRKRGGEIIWMLGGHSVKCGLSPLLIKLMQEGFITHLATNGAVPIHDFELAYQGSTSEDVDQSLQEGRFGMAKETGIIINQAIIKGAQKNKGYGEIIGELISKSSYPFKQLSIFKAAYELKIPSSIHSAIGAEIIYQHPEMDGSAIGKVSFLDFQKFTQTIKKLEGGAILNIGSAVIMPEVFLKALSIVRNQGIPTKSFVAANFDMLAHYRPLTNILQRPGGKAYDFRGHHEIMLPLLAYALLNKK